MSRLHLAKQPVSRTQKKNFRKTDRGNTAINIQINKLTDCCPVGMNVKIRRTKAGIPGMYRGFKMKNLKDTGRSLGLKNSKEISAAKC